MKGLLHSKLFRKNLFKWIFMYVTVIGLFTSVVTYSKYISSMQEKDSARVAMFDASITYDGICAGINENETCDIGVYRPTSSITYYFTVDTTELEVSTIFVIRISVAELFKNVKIYDITDVEKKLEFVEGDSFFDKNYNFNVYNLVDNELKVDETGIRKYKMTMDYDHATYDPEYKASHPYYEVVTIGYSAEQIK